MRVKNVGTHSYFGVDSETKAHVSIAAGESAEVSDAFGKYLLHDTDSPGKFEKVAAESKKEREDREKAEADAKAKADQDAADALKKNEGGK